MAAFVAGLGTPGQLWKEAVLDVQVPLPMAPHPERSSSPEGSVLPDRRVLQRQPQIEKLHAKLPASRAAISHMGKRCLPHTQLGMDLHKEQPGSTQMCTLLSFA